MGISNVFFGGVPTEPDVRKIREEWPDESLTVGEVIPYALVAHAIGCDRASNRYRTVTHAWRKAVEAETNKIIGVKAGVGFVVLDEHEKVSLARSKLRSAGHNIRRTITVCARTDSSSLTDQERAARDHMQTTSAKMLSAGQVRSRRELPDMTSGK